MIFTIVLTASFIQFLVAVFILSRKVKDVSNVLFACLSFSLIGWALANYYSTLPDSSYLLLSMRLVMLLVVLQNTSLALFCYSFPANSIRMNSYIRFYLLFSAVTALFTMTTLVFSSATFVNGTPQPTPGPGMLLFLIHAVVSVAMGIRYLYTKWKKAAGAYKEQLLFIAVGALLLWTVVPLTNLVITLVFQTTIFVRLSSIYVLIFSSIIAYAIVKHKLFDIRLVVARSVAYILVVLTMALVYGYFVFGFIDRFFPGTQTSALQQALYTFSAVFLAFTFQYIKRFFDRLTNQVFYRDNYDTEDVLNRLGKIFISKSNSFESLDESLKVIAGALKVEYAKLVVLDSGTPYKIVQVGNSARDEDYNDKLLNRFKNQVNVVDELEDIRLRNTLQGMGAQALVRLTVEKNLTGYLFLGAKQSGTTYTRQDINFLEILSQELAVAIQNAKSYEEIQAFSKTLENEVKEATAKLRETNKRLVKLDEAKDEFISMASHQLRTPLTTIKGYLSMLVEGDAGHLSKKHREFIDLAYVSSERMVHLISDMLNVSRISTDRLSIEKSEFDLVSVVEDELVQLRRQVDAHGAKVNFRKPHSGAIMVNLDESKIRQVIMNFTDNAIYYSNDKPIDIVVEVVDGAVEFRVEDKGIGIPKEEQKQLFTKFFRADNAKKIRPDGTGLGLYVAKRVIEVQDGEIIFASQKGKGSTFGFRFKLENNQSQ